MKSHLTITLCVIATVVVGTLVGPTSTRAQEAAVEALDEAVVTQVEEEEEIDAEPRTPPATAATAIPDIVPLEPSGRFGMSGLRKSAAALRDAETDEAKAKARQQLTQRIEQYFDEDMQRREAELAKIEERVRKLREQLDLRRAKKQEIIDLQIHVAVNEAQGLGFFSQPAERGGRGPLAPAASLPSLPFEQPTRPADDPFRGPVK